MASCVIIGVDVGGTNTDAVSLSLEKGGKGAEDLILATAKCETTRDITTGVQRAIVAVIQKTRDRLGAFSVARVHIGTTHFVNALLQKKHLARVSVIRLCGPASVALPPFVDIPGDLCDSIKGTVHMINGGYQFDGQVITEPDPKEIEKTILAIKSAGIRNIVCSGVFSPVRGDHEFLVRDIINKVFPESSVTLSREMGYVGLLERENAAILNECLKPLCVSTMKGFRNALDELKLKCPLFLTQNDGTIISENRALEFPVYTMASGPTNSMRGAAFISGVEDGLVIDIGGTTTDVGALVKNFPREANRQTKIADVRTSFTMPDLLSIALGGGSFVNEISDGGKLVDVKVGPLSTGYRLREEALVFGTGGSRRLTATDVAVASGLVAIGDKKLVDGVPKSLISKSNDKIRHTVEEVIDRIKLSSDEIPVVLVGGGICIIDQSSGLKGASKVIVPANHDVANAIGAALSQVSGYVDEVIDLQRYMDGETSDDAETKDAQLLNARNKAKEEILEKANAKAIANGASSATLKITEFEDIGLAYVPGNATRMKAKAVGDLKFEVDLPSCSSFGKDDILPTIGIDKLDDEMMKKQISTVTGNVLCNESGRSLSNDPKIDKSTGEWIISEYDIECISIGAGILGCGGGGNPYLGRILALKYLKESQRMRVKAPQMLKEDDVGVHVAFMGAPVIMYEKLVSGTEIKTAFSTYRDLYSIGKYKAGEVMAPEYKKLVKSEGTSTFIDDVPKTPDSKSAPESNIVAILSAEIGGMNSIEPLILGHELNLPVVDADGMGRAFPELQMFTPFIYDCEQSPACLSDEKGTRAAMLKFDNPKVLENHFRNVCVQMGCSGGLVMAALNKKAILDKSVPYSYSRARRLGNAILDARNSNNNITDAVLKIESGRLLISGTVRDINRSDAAGGFTRGTITIGGTDNFSDSKLLVNFQNENLIAKAVGSDGSETVLACTPDLVCIIETDSGEPIPSEEMRYGLRVTVLALACDPLISSEKALKIVGPRAFGYDIDYKPVATYKKQEPICPLE